MIKIKEKVKNNEKKVQKVKKSVENKNIYYKMSKR